MTAGNAAVGCCSLLFWAIACLVAAPQTTAESFHHVGTAVGKSEPRSSKSGLNGNESAFHLLLIGGSSAAVECHSVVQLNGSQWCSFVKTTEDCKLDSGFIDYLQGAICGFRHNLLPLAVFLYAIWLFYLFAFLGTTAELFFCPNLAAIAASLKLSHNVAGVTFLALGNGAPDVFSAIAAFSDPRTANLAIGALFGAGIFVTTIVAGGVALASPFIVASRPFLRDVIFYMAAVFWTFLILYFGSIDLGEALGYLALYAVYVLTVIISSLIYQKCKNQEHASLNTCQSEYCDVEDTNPSCIRIRSHEDASEYQPLIRMEESKSTKSILLDSLNPINFQEWRRKRLPWKIFKCLLLPIEFFLLICIPVVDFDQEGHNWKRPLNCLQVVTGSLVCILAFKSGYYGLLRIGDQLPVWVLVLLISLIIAALIFFTTKNEEPPKYHCVFSFIGFLFSTILINTVATEVVNLLRAIGIIFNLSNTVLGLTLLAWGNSVGDLFSDITLARQGYQRMAIAACFGGIIFNMLFGIGLSSLIQMPYNNNVLEIKCDGLLDWILVGSLGLSLVMSFILIPVQRFKLGKAYGGILVSFYVLFIIVALLTEAGIIHV
ncbi:mitochondrial sodium/calcium exchanger protein [Hemiscyllium ocellatum]|uniref:mitochondrial sodium/calcium exchanger protein n=1 Tax=Hemiscyllium ocellatum TaxID=170820 RepID=UPI002966D7AC|nr:mitochondrial sodium/calcium exchanger protein [Hemiscyllium ocellatum]XP_060699675.1 mitochondrial sodium/calcium exchanger protein [Hemiscyllium ocellatum]